MSVYGAAAVIQELREKLDEQDYKQQQLAKEIDRLRDELAVKQLEIEKLKHVEPVRSLCDVDRFLKIERGVERARINKRSQSIDQLQIPEYISSHLFDYQTAGVKFLLETLIGRRVLVPRFREPGKFDTIMSHGAILADAMGLGKTIQSICSIFLFATTTKLLKCRSLIICPLTVIPLWISELKKVKSWVGNQEGTQILGHMVLDSSMEYRIREEVIALWRSQGGFLFIGYEFCREILSHSSFNDFVIGKEGADLSFLDEGHKIRNLNKVNASLSQMFTDRRIILTGYPLQNNLHELFNMIAFACPVLTQRIFSSFEAYRDFFMKPTFQERLGNESRSISRKRSHFLFSLLRDHGMILRRNSKFLSKRIKSVYEIVVRIKPSLLQARIYKELLSHTNYWSCFQAFTTLSMLCDHPDVLYRYAQSGTANNTQALLLSTFEKIDLDLSFTKAQFKSVDYSGKMVVMMTILIESHKQKDKVLVFSRWLHTLSYIEDLINLYNSKTMLDEPVIKFARIDGSLSQSKKEALISSFSPRDENSPSDYNVLLITTACGEGIDLSLANRVVIMDVNWNPNTDLQACMRVFRPGQTKRTYVYRLVCDGVLESRMFDRQNGKRELSSWVIDGELLWSVSPGGKEWNDCLKFDEELSDFQKTVRLLPGGAKKDPVTSALFRKHGSLEPRGQHSGWISRIEHADTLFRYDGNSQDTDGEIDEEFSDVRKEYSDFLIHSYRTVATFET